MHAWLVSLEGVSCRAQYYDKASSPSKESRKLFCRVAFNTFVKTIHLHLGEATSSFNSLAVSHPPSSFKILLRSSPNQNRDRIVCLEKRACRPKGCSA